MTTKRLIALATKTDGTKLLRQTTVVDWILDNTEFLKDAERRAPELKRCEDVWGKTTMSDILNIKTKIQWTSLFGEHLCKEILLMQNKTVWRPTTKGGFRPDFETDDWIVEVKTGTWYTNGTAHEKILGTALKYRNIPELYKKKLLIVCIGRAEREARKYGLFGSSDEKMEDFLQLIKGWNIEYIAATDLLNRLCVDE
jgi:hypothetical protein